MTPITPYGVPPSGCYMGDPSARNVAVVSDCRGDEGEG